MAGQVQHKGAAHARHRFYGVALECDIGRDDFWVFRGDATQMTVDDDTDKPTTVGMSLVRKFWAGRRACVRIFSCLRSPRSGAGRGVRVVAFALLSCA